LTIKTEKSALRKVLLEKRDLTSHDFIEIASKKIHENLKKIVEFRNAANIACYYPIGSEVMTQDIIQEALSNGKQISLPKTIGDKLSFKKITNLSSLEKSRLGILEPKDECPDSEKIQVILVPTIGISRDGQRLGYGYGFYDRFLATTEAKKIALTFSKQIVKSIPASENDVKIDWIVTEDEFFKTSKVS